MNGFAVDTSKPVPGPWRMPSDAERRTRVYLARPWRDCVDVCEVNPDLEETTDATMRVIAAAPDAVAALRRLALAIESEHPGIIDADYPEVRAALAKAGQPL